MRVTVVRPGDLGPGEASLWARFQKSSAELQNPFFALTFAQTVGRHRLNSRVAVVEADGAIQAFLPFDLGPQRIGLPIGDPMNNLQGFVSDGATIDARQVIRKAGLRGWRYTAAPAGQPALAAHHYAGTLVEAPLIDLSDGYTSYYVSRSKKFTADFGKQWRSLERRVGPVSLEWGAAAPDHIHQLMEWKAAKYYGARQVFSDPATRKIVEELAVTSNEDCAGLVTVLRAGERIVAVSANLMCPGVLCGWFTAYDHDMAKFSPGKLAMLATAEEAARRDITRFELGAGQDSYKGRITNASHLVAGGGVWVIPGERAARGLYRRLYLERKMRRDVADKADAASSD
ncbi:MAG: GNAT family N-acetyltransferase [Trebonia sp.]|jgi:CelD/BcsL family acetyltransferase involved in cellulose biosynthesis